MALGTEIQALLSWQCVYPQHKFCFLNAWIVAMENHMLFGRTMTTLTADTEHHAIWVILIACARKITIGGMSDMALKAGVEDGTIKRLLRISGTVDPLIGRGIVRDLQLR